MQKAWEVDDTTLRFYQNWENWYGSFYELGLAYAHGSLDQQTRLHLLQYVWDDPTLLGVVDNTNGFGNPWKKVESADTSDGNHLYGCIRLSTEHIVGCGSYFSSDGSFTWFGLYIPLSMLELVYAVDYRRSITHQGNPWTIKVDKVLAPIGVRIYREFPFKLGAVGEEAAAFPVERHMAELTDNPGLLVPESLFKRQSLSPYGVRSPEGLWWTGCNEKLKGD